MPYPAEYWGWMKGYVRCSVTAGAADYTNEHQGVTGSRRNVSSEPAPLLPFGASYERNRQRHLLGHVVRSGRKDCIAALRLG